MRSQKARLPPLGRDRPDLDLRVVGDHAGKDLEAGTGEVLGHGLHLDRVAQVRLVGAVLADRLVIGNAAELWVTGLPSANASNTPRMTGSIVSQTSSWVTKLISRSSW
jgi:hypothetical protein